MKENLLKSRMVRIFVISIIILTVGLAAMFLLAGREPELDDFADVVIPFGYESMRVLDDEEGILAVREPGGFLKLINYDGNLLAELEPFTAVGHQQGDCISLESADGWTVANFRDLMAGKNPIAASYDLVEIDRNGKY
ncbi:MAG: hypothetical protein II354_04030, partial [Firmicutes bacterium]|nr:hypothetical protein [Bacillota bacterium]